MARPISKIFLIGHPISLDFSDNFSVGRVNIPTLMRRAVWGRSVMGASCKGKGVLVLPIRKGGLWNGIIEGEIVIRRLIRSEFEFFF
jgi:hypothetical protein